MANLIAQLLVDKLRVLLEDLILEDVRIRIRLLENLLQDESPPLDLPASLPMLLLDGGAGLVEVLAKQSFANIRRLGDLVCVRSLTAHEFPVLFRVTSDLWRLQVLLECAMDQVKAGELEGVPTDQAKLGTDHLVSGSERTQDVPVPRPLTAPGVVL